LGLWRIAKDDVKVWADDGIFIDAAITAGDDIQVRTCGDVVLWAGRPVLLAAQLVARDDIELYSRSDLRILGNIRAGDDFSAYARGDFDMSANIEGFDRINLWARGDLTLAVSSVLGMIDGEPARHVCLHAGHRMILDGTINLGEKEPKIG